MKRTITAVLVASTIMASGATTASAGFFSVASSAFVPGLTGTIYSATALGSNGAALLANTIKVGAVIGTTALIAGTIAGVGVGITKIVESQTIEDAIIASAIKAGASR